METSAKSSVTRIINSKSVETTRKSMNVMWSSEKKLTMNSRTAKRAQSVRFSEERMEHRNSERSVQSKLSRSSRKSVSFEDTTQPRVARLRSIEIKDYGDKINMKNGVISIMSSNSSVKGKKSNEMTVRTVTLPNDQNTVAKPSKSNRHRRHSTVMNSSMDEFDELLQNSKSFRQLTDNVTKLLEMHQMFMTRQAQLEQNMDEILKELRMCRPKRQLQQGQPKMLLEHIGYEQELNMSKNSKKRKRDASVQEHTMSYSNLNEGIGNSVQEQRVTRHRISKSTTINERTITRETDTIEPPPKKSAVNQQENSHLSHDRMNLSKIDTKNSSTFKRPEIPIKSKRIEQDRLKRSKTIDERTSIDPMPKSTNQQLHKINNRRNSHVIVSTKNKSNVYKNTNKSLYFNNPETKRCVLCQKYYEKIVSHCKTIHRDQEVFASRLSPIMADELRRERPKCTTRTIKHNKLIEAKCYFCEINKSFSLSYWLIHIQSHTGEYAYICRVCNIQSSYQNQHCGIKMTKITDQDDNRLNITAFLCLDCNFIQLYETNMHKHLKTQHAVSERSFSGKYTTVTLLSKTPDKPLQLDEPIIERLQTLKEAVEHSTKYVEGNLGILWLLFLVDFLIFCTFTLV